MVRESEPPASNRTTHEIRANPEIFWEGAGVGGMMGVNRQLFIDIITRAVNFHAPRRGRLIMVAGVMHGRDDLLSYHD